MEQAQQTASESAPGPPAGYSHRVWAYTLIALAVALVVFGFYRMYSYADSDRIVSGDAYNYGILATRGVGFIAAGAASACIAATLMLIALYEQRR